MEKCNKLYEQTIKDPLTRIIMFQLDFECRCLLKQWERIPLLYKEMEKYGDQITSRIYERLAGN